MTRSLRYWIAKYTARWFRPARPVRRTVELRLEGFEDRLVPTTVTVTSLASSGSGTLAAAISSLDSNPGTNDAIVFDPSLFTGGPQTISLTSALPTITDSMSITGPALDNGQPRLAIKPGNVTFHRIFDISNVNVPGTPPLAVTLQNLTIERGLPAPDANGDTLGGGIRFAGVAGVANSLTVSHCDLLNNRASASSSGGNAAGGAIYTANVALTVTACVVSDNATSATPVVGATESSQGGGVFCSGGSATITGSTFGPATVGGTAYPGNSATLNGSTDASGDAFGGGLCTRGATLSLTDSTLSGNTAAGSSGSGDNLTGFDARGGSFGGNASGGGLYHNGLGAILTRVTVSANVAQGGSAALAPAGGGTTGLPDGLKSQGGSADGGGIDAIVPHTGQGFTIIDSEVDDNQALGGAADIGYVNNGNSYGGSAGNGGMDVLTTADDGTTLTAAGEADGCTFAGDIAQGGAANTTVSQTTSGFPFGGYAFAGGLTVSNLLDSTVAADTARGGDAYINHGIFPGPSYPGAAAGGGFGGGPVFPSLSVPYTIANSTIAGNFAYTGMANYTQNRVEAIGGGVADAMIVTNPVDGSFTIDQDTNVYVYSTIIAENFLNATVSGGQYVNGGLKQEPDIYGGNSYGHNLIGFTDGNYNPNFVPRYGGPFNMVVPNANGDLVGPASTLGTMPPYDPGLVLDGTAAAQPTPLLAQNGGLTRTVALEPDGNSIDNGANAGVTVGTTVVVPVQSYDQREFPFARSIDQTGGTSINYLPGDGTDVGAYESQTLPAPTVVYADTRWVGLPTWYPIADADPVATGNQPGSIGYNAFASVDDALNAAAAGGTVIVNGDDGSGNYGHFAEGVGIGNGETLVVQEGPVTFNALSGDASASVVLSGVNLSTGDGEITDFEGSISGTGSLTKTGSGTFILGGTNTYSGTTTLSAGTLVVNGTLSTGGATVTVASGTTLTGSGAANRLVSLSAGGVVSAEGNSFTIGSLTGTGTVNDTTATPGTINIGSDNTNSTFAGTIVDGGTAGLKVVKIGTGTLTLTGNSNTYTGATTISGGTLQVGDGVTAGVTGGTVPGNVTDNATLAFDEPNAYTFADAISGTGSVTQLGTGDLTFSGVNSYSGGTTTYDNSGNSLNVYVAGGSSLGVGGVTLSGLFSALTTVSYSASNTAVNAFILNGGVLSVPSGVTLTLSGAEVGDGYLGGFGTFSTSAMNAALFSGVASNPSTTIASNNVADQFVNFTCDGALNVAAGQVNSGTSLNFNGFVIEGSGTVTIGASTQLNIANFQSYGVLTLAPGTSSYPTQLTNRGSVPLYFNTGSRTYLSVSANAGLFDAGIDLFGKNAIVSDGWVNNNGYVVDSGASGTATFVSDYGSLVKGNGFWQNTVQTADGGRFLSGDCPGFAQVGHLAFGPAGVDQYEFQITDATGTAGPAPDAQGHAAGWSLINAGDFAWTADENNKFTVNLQTLTSDTTEGNDVAGAVANFDPTKSYSWAAVHWTGAYTGPSDVTTLNAATDFETSAFVNAAGGKFSWQLDTAAQTLSLVYTPPPAVSAVQLDGGPDGSVASLTVTFSTAVSFANGDAAAAFRLINTDSGAVVNLSASVSTDTQGRTVVTLTFSGGTLAAGHYQLGVLANAVTGADGTALDGSGTGTQSGVDYLGSIWTIGS